MTKIGYLGVLGSHSYLQAYHYFGNNHEYIGVSSFAELFNMIEGQKAFYAVVPIENSLIGSIHENYDELYAHQLQIVGESYARIEHCLLGFRETHAIKDLQRVYSHPKALAQCQGFLRQHPEIECVHCPDTASAAAIVRQLQDPTCAAIASEMAAEHYGLDLLQKNLEDDPQNYTRFVFVAKGAPSNDEVNKCSLWMRLKHTPGSLSSALHVFSEYNLTKIESRPFKGSLFEYVFHIDLVFMEQKRAIIKESLSKKLDCAESWGFLGFYQAGRK